jgi:high-affinity iron transporter
VSGLLLAIALAAPSLADTATLLQLVDYVGVDYGEAVAGGEVINAAEYGEMQEFSSRIRDSIAGLEPRPERHALADDARRLAARIAAKAPPEEIAALTRRMRDALLRAYPVPLVPGAAPDLVRAARLYQESCASCHGADGRGDGPSAAGLDPPPIDFHDAARARQRSLYGLYNTITLGVDGTGMASFAYLSDADRWALAFLVGGLAADQGTLARAEAVSEGGSLPTLREAVTASPAELAEVDADAEALAWWARHHPDALFRFQPDPIATALALVDQSTAAYAAGDRRRAQELAVAAYLDGFELAEAALGNVAPALVRSVEDTMMAFRAAQRAGAPTPEVARRASTVSALLQRAGERLQRETLSPAVSFSGGFVILLREGLEAILILGAMVAFLSRTGRREALPWVAYGSGAALLLGVGTWAVATWLLAVSGATREVAEGVTALLAAAILFYVGFWMHSRVNAQQWQRFLQDKLRRALDARTLAGIALISFFAVYREVFETVLFYQALWVQAPAGGRGAVLGGAAAAAGVLVGGGWAVVRLGVRLPLRQVFAASGAVMFLLAVVFAGKGTMALQEAGKLPVSPVAFPRLELLGVYPNLESLGVQVLLAVAAAGLIWWSQRPRSAAA